MICTHCSRPFVVCLCQPEFKLKKLANEYGHKLQKEREEHDITRAERAAAFDKLQKAEGERDASQRAYIECQGVRDGYRMEWETALKEHVKTKSALAELTFRFAEFRAEMMGLRETITLLEELLEQSINYRGATLRELKDERERADALFYVVEAGYDSLLAAKALEAHKRARASQSVRIPARIGPPLEFNSNDDLRIDKEDK